MTRSTRFMSASVPRMFASGADVDDRAAAQFAPQDRGASVDCRAETDGCRERVEQLEVEVAFEESPCRLAAVTRTLDGVDSRQRDAAQDERHDGGGNLRSPDETTRCHDAAVVGLRD